MEEPETAGDPEVVKKLGVGQNHTARRWLTRLIILLVVGSLIGGVVFWRVQVGKTPTERWVTAAAEVGDLRETVTATGTLSPLDSVEVGAEVTGRVVKVHVDINDPVKAGQVLVEIDPEQLVARVEESQAQLRGAQADFSNAKATVGETELKAQRLRELHKKGLVSDQELETAEAALARAKAGLTSSSAKVTVAQAGLKSASTSRSKARITSPIDGIVLARSVEPGQTVTSGFQTPILFTLARDLTQMRLKVDVDEADVGKVREGQRARFVVDAYPGRNFNSKVARLNNLPKTGTTVITYEALLIVDNSERLLRPGMTATATIVTSEKKGVLSVPNAALRFRPTSPGDSAGARPGMGLPVPGLGGGMRGTRGMGGGQRGGGAASPAGSAAAGGGSRSEGGRGTVYVLRGEAGLAPVEVRTGASDGRRTEIQGEGISVGTEVVVDVEEAPK